MTRPSYDVVVLGGGNAGLSAALAARAAGASVAVIEAAPRHLRGGNSRHTRNLRVAHERPTSIVTDAYTEDEFWTDLMRVSGSTDEALARMLIGRSGECVAWMEGQGARFQAPLKGTLHLGRTNAFFLGGGKAGSRMLDLRASGQVIKFDGFLALYQEGKDDDGDDEDCAASPP